MLSGGCLAQASANHNTYSGPYPESHSFGKATYSYLTSESGERIFDGHFTYTHPSEWSLKGNFKNNRQIGKWIQTTLNNSPGPKALLKTVTTANFGANGYLDGHFRIQDYYRNGTIIDVLDATYRNGRLNGPFKGIVKEGDFSGQYKNGVPVGLWKYSWLEAPVDFDRANDNGYVLVKHVNPATGDISESYESMPTYPDCGIIRPIEWWLRDILMRDSRKIVFHPSFPYKERSLINGCFEGRREAGFEEESEAYFLRITIPRDLLNNKDVRGDWSDWDDFVLRNCKLDINEIGSSPVNVNLLLDVDSGGNVDLIEKDDKVSDVLNDETLRLLKELQWILGYESDGIMEKRARRGMRAYCNVEVTFDPTQMKSNLEVLNDKKQKKQKQIEAAKQYEESFAPISEKIEYNLASKESEDDDKIYDNVQEVPQFPGGRAGLAQFISQNLRYPISAQENGVSGTVFVGFVVRKDGTISDGKIIRGRHSDLNKEALRIVKMLPKFKPGKLNGKPVNVRFTLPINFRMGN